MESTAEVHPIRGGTASNAGRDKGTIQGKTQVHQKKRGNHTVEKHMQDYPKGISAWTPSPAQGLTKGHTTQALSLVKDSSTKPDAEGC